MSDSAEPERRGVADAPRTLPVQATACDKSSFLHQNVASETLSSRLEWRTSRRSNVFRHRLDASLEVATAREIGPVIPARTETAGTANADEDSFRRKALHLMREEPEGDLDEPLPRHGRNQSRDEVGRAPGSEAGRWRLAVPTS